MLAGGGRGGIGRARGGARGAGGAPLAWAPGSEAGVAALADRLDTDAVAVPTDVREEDDVEALVSATVERFGGIDVLVNNAGLGRGSSVSDLSTEAYREMMETNADGMFFAARAALPHLKESGGTAVFVGSFAGQFPRTFNPAYAATKWGTRGFAKTLSAQAGGAVAGPRVNPPEGRTEFGSYAGHGV